MTNYEGSSHAVEPNQKNGPSTDPGQNPRIEVAILEVPMAGGSPRSETRPTSDGQSSARARRLRRSLARELIQTETSTRMLCSREAKHLDTAPPAAALLAASLHADKALRSMLQHAPDQPTIMVGAVSGAVMSTVRQALMDYVLSGEQAYRSTLLELRHGLDVVSMLHTLALREGDIALAAWCEEWLSMRLPIVQEAQAQLAWFAENLDAATARPLRRRIDAQAARPQVQVA